MLGIIIITAGQDEAYRDYQKTIQNGVALEEIESHLSEEDFNQIQDAYGDEDARIWGTASDSKWRKVAPRDIALVYRGGKYIAQGRVVYTTENAELASQLWNTSRDSDGESAPWKYLTFLTDIEKIEVGAEAFNELVGYDSSYRPQGFTRVADFRLAEVRDSYDSIETAIADLTGAGIRVHEVEEETTETDEEEQETLADRLVRASEDGDRDVEFEKLVAKAFTRLGCETRWVEGGGDTDVEITAPVHTVVDTKARSRAQGVANIHATRINSHRKQRGADHAIVVSRHFPPSVIEDAEATDITTLTADRLVRLLELREEYGLPPEDLFELLTEPGAFQDDRIDELIERINSRTAGMESLLEVIEGLEHAKREVRDAGDLHWIIVGMSDPESAPEENAIEHALDFLSHPSLQIIEQDGEGFHLRTSTENAVEILRAIPALVERVDSDKSAEGTES